MDRGWPKRNVLESNKETTSDYTGRKHGYLGGTQAVWITQNGFLSSTFNQPFSLPGLATVTVPRECTVHTTYIATTALFAVEQMNSRASRAAETTLHQSTPQQVKCEKG